MTVENVSFVQKKRKFYITREQIMILTFFIMDIDAELCFKMDCCFEAGLADYDLDFACTHV